MNCCTCHGRLCILRIDSFCLPLITTTTTTTTTYYVPCQAVYPWVHFLARLGPCNNACSSSDMRAGLEPFFLFLGQKAIWRKNQKKKMEPLLGCLGLVKHFRFSSNPPPPQNSIAGKSCLNWSLGDFDGLGRFERYSIL